MSPIEQSIIQLLEKIKKDNLKATGNATFFQGLDEEEDHIQLQATLIELKSHELLSISLEFINHDVLSEYLTHPDQHLASAFSDGKINPSIGYFLFFWKKIRNAIEPISSSDDEILERIKSSLDMECAIYNEKRDRGDGTAMHDPNIYHPSVFRAVYQSNRESLITLFQSAYGDVMPKEESFIDSPVPQPVRNKTYSIIKTLHELALARPNVPFETFDHAAVVIQRVFRRSARNQTYITLLSQLAASNKIPQEPVSDPRTWKPRCNNATLATRIVRLYKAVNLFQTVRHLTNQKALASIFNDGLFGQKNLVDNLMVFKPAALVDDDIARGDSNVICLGPNAIHSLWIDDNTVEIVFNADVLLNSCAPIFMKQRDFGFDTSYQRDKFPRESLFPGSEDIDFKDISFTCSESSYFNIFSIEFMVFKQDIPFAHATFPFNEFLFNNHRKPNLHEMLASSFFKFWDSLACMPEHKGSGGDQNVRECVNQFYSKLSKLTDEELKNFIERVGKALLTTAEFNIYGAYRIDDFAMIERITSGYKWTIESPLSEFEAKGLPYTLCLKDFLSGLNEGDTHVIETAVQNIPELFKSYRFLDYLILKTTESRTKSQLQDLRALCVLPRWLKTVNVPGFFNRAPESDHLSILETDRPLHP
jgi:hypothetical protein